jgi:predicted Zn-dependent protease
MVLENARAALVWLDSLVRDDPSEPAYLSAAGRAHLMIGDLEGARVCFDAAEKMTMDLGKDATEEQRLEVMRDRGEYLLVSLKFEDAKTAFAEALRARPDDVAATVNAAVAAVYGGDLDSSRTLLENGLVAAQKAPLGSELRDMVTPSAVKNLNSIYELTARVPAETKRNMSVFVKSFAPDDFDTTCLSA